MLNIQSQLRIVIDIILTNMKYLFGLLLLVLVVCDDRLPVVPGYPADYKPQVFAGYLNTSSSLRYLHYILLESEKGQNNTDPLTLWMNGGPGCSSKLGFIQEIGPYYLDINKPYKVGDNLTKNEYGWNKLTNLLFIDNPAGVGFSVNKDASYIYNDENTVKDTLDALIHFFTVKYPQYINRTFYIAGESYAGKYIPDLAVRIHRHNQQSPETAINLKGIFVGNGVMSFQDGQLDRSQVDFMVDRQIIDPELLNYWRDSCLHDEQSAGCNYFLSRYDQLTSHIDPYNIYGPCYAQIGEDKSPTQRTLLMKAAKKYSKRPPKYKFGLDCSYDHGLQQYFTLNSHIWNSQVERFSACSDKIFSTYDMQVDGSINQYKFLLNVGKYRIILYNGDWDDVVPYTDTLKNFKKMDLVAQGEFTPWIVNSQHAGFWRQYPGLVFYRVKKAGHQVPMYQRQNSFELFKIFLGGS